MSNGNDTEASATPGGKPRNGKRRRALVILTSLFVLAGVAYALLYFFVFTWRETTDDAYVGGNQVTLTPQVTGTVVAILADETQLVKAGQPIVKLDPTDANVALAEARTALAEAVRQVRQEFAQAHQYQAVLDQRKLDLDRARADYERRAPLLAEHAVPAEEVAHAKDALDAAETALRTAEGQFNAARAPIEGVSIEQNPSVLAAREKLREAWLAAQRNAIPSPVTGYVAKRSVQVGQRVTPGTQLMTIVPMDQLWVDANFKEGELRNIRIGQPAAVTTDLYGSGIEFRGRVAGLGAGTGSAFSLLPAQNATGNWIKIVQRLPVRIELDPQELQKHPLRIGLSMTAKVNLHDQSGPVLSQKAPSKPVFSTDVYERGTREADALIAKIIADNSGASGNVAQSGK